MNLRSWGSPWFVLSAPSEAYSSVWCEQGPAPFVPTYLSQGVCLSTGALSLCCQVTGSCPFPRGTGRSLETEGLPRAVAAGGLLALTFWGPGGERWTFPMSWPIGFVGPTGQCPAKGMGQQEARWPGARVHHPDQGNQVAGVGHTGRATAASPPGTPGPGMRTSAGPGRARVIHQFTADWQRGSGLLLNSVYPV